MAKKREKNRKIRIDRVIIVIAIAAGIIALLASAVHMDHRHTAAAATAVPAVPSAVPSPSSTPEPTPLVDPSTFTDTDSVLLLANKKHRLPEGYVPDNLVNVQLSRGNEVQMKQEAADAVKKMAEAAEKDGVYLGMSSAYRSEDYQRTLYSNYSAQYGTATADTISSRPGYSDHQTGLAADFIEGDGGFDGYNFNAKFEETDSGKWLKEHAHEYGFIMRYPKGKDAITGYEYEPWHYRYVGVKWAEMIYDVSPDETFEEFFDVEGGDYADAESSASAQP